MNITGVEAAETIGSASTEAIDRAKDARYRAPIDYSERLFKIKQLEYKRDAKERMIAVCNHDEDLIAEFIEINAQISKLLEDE